MNNILDPKSIPKFKDELPIPKTFVPKLLYDPNTLMITGEYYYVTISEFKQQVLPSGYPKTTVWGYGGKVVDNDTGNIYYNYSSYPGPTFDVKRGVPSNIQWVNNLKGENPLAVDPTLHWADPNKIGKIQPELLPKFPPGLKKTQYPVPIVTHLHGGETSSVFDGYPDAWFTYDEKIIGENFATSLYEYNNMQPPTTLWYHDHTLGTTRINVYMGLAGFYIIRDLKNSLDIPGNILPPKKYEIPLVIQDRTFNEDGTFYFPNEGDNPSIHPYWQPEFFGNSILVNGKTWPKLTVEMRRYRFRLLNGSNARFYNLFFSNNMEFVQIGSDGGYLPKSVKLNKLVIAPGQRADILVDFSKLNYGDEIILNNDAPTTYPDGDPVDPSTAGCVMKFIVKGDCKVPSPMLPGKLNNIPELVSNGKNRMFTLVRIRGEGGPIQFLLDGQKWSAPITEKSVVGSTEEWEFLNLTADTHPIHLHLVQFLIKNRQQYDSDKYNEDWLKLNGNMPFNHPTKIIDPTNYLKGDPMEPELNEKGWNDTVLANPGEITRIVVRFAPIDVDPKMVKPGVNLYPFNPQVGPGYVWHCHMLDHEDNEMMRPLIIVDK